MSDNLDKELEEIMRIVNIDHTKPAVNTPQRQRMPQHSQKRQASRYSSSDNGRNRKAIKRRKQRKIRRWIITSCVIAVFALLVVLICKGCAGDTDATADLIGVWHYDQYTEYEFDGEGNGCMCLDGNNHFKFTYKTEGGTLYLDFVLDYVTDCQYTYTVDDDKLTLVGGEGTAVVGKIYSLTKIS